MWQEQTTRELEAVYALRDQVLPRDQSQLYADANTHVQSHSTSNIEQWINTWRNTMKASAAAAKKLGLQAQRSIRNWFGGDQNHE